MAAQVPTAELEELSVQNAGSTNGKGGATHASLGGSTNGNLNHESDDSDDDKPDVANEDGTAPAAGEAKKRKKKKKKKAKKKTKGGSATQTEPPRVLISQLFPNENYPRGEEVEYLNENSYRTTSEEKRHLESLDPRFLIDYRHAAEAHRTARQWAQRNIKPGWTLTDIANGIEDTVRAVVGHQGLEEGDAIVAGMGFPTGLSLNHCAAHYTPNAGNKMVLAEDDVIKVDIGVHVNGRIVDSAFTMAFRSRYDNLLAAVKDATNAGVREAGIDVRLGDIGGVIQEVIESYEVEIDGTTYPVKSIRNLSGHTINHYSIHGSKSVPIVKSNDMTKMEEGDVFAIETFGSTGQGYVHEEGEVSHYALRDEGPSANLRLQSAKTLLNVIKKNFNTLPFCRRYLDRLVQDKYLLGLNSLVNSGIVESYPPLVDKKGSYTAQYEHTILLRPTVKEVISRGDDF